MPDMTLSYDYTLSTKTGHSVEFKAGVPTYVVPQAVPEALAIGATEGDAPVVAAEPEPTPE